MEYCPHCMRPATGTFCENCGGQIQWQNPVCQIPVGTLLRGSTGRVYQIGAAKGQGGFGITYAAMDLASWDRVAIKEYYPSSSASRDTMNTVIPTTGQTESFRKGMDSFLEEGRMLSTVGALPSVVSVRDSFEANGTAYIVMEYVDGQPLHEVVKKRGRIPWEELKAMLTPLMRDLDILHRAGDIHRDISPDNLILTPQNTLKLLDFGSARSVHSGDMTVMLKAGFSPVEQYQSKGQGPYTDVYALAGTIYYCLTGVIPPTAMDRMVQDDLKSPNAYGAELTAGEVHALLWGMAVQPSARPGTMQQFAQALLEGASEQKTGVPRDEKDDQPDTRTEQTQTESFTSTGSESRNGRPQGGGKKKLGAILGAAAAAVLLVIVSLVLILGGSKTSGDFKYKVSGGNARVVGYVGSSRDVTIPEKLNGYPVTEIGKNAFSGCGNLSTVTVPGGVASVGKNAFRDCVKLELVLFQESNTTVEVDDTAFSGCDSLLCLVGGSERRVIRWNGIAQSDAVVCYLGSDTGHGTVCSVENIGGITYAMTSWDCAVALKEPSGSLSLPAFLDGRRVFDSQGDRVSVESGVTDEGVEYELCNGEAYIVGYRGDESFFSMPDDIDDYPVTMICGGALAGNDTIEVVLMPVKLVTIQAEAFRGCDNLVEVDIYSKAETVDPTAFRDCPRLRCILGYEAITTSLSGAELDDNCRLLNFSMETGDGKLSYADVTSDGAIYAITVNDTAVLMDVPAGATRLEIPDKLFNTYPVNWVHSSALEHASSDVTIVMASNMAFPLGLYDRANCSYNDVEDFCASWLITCAVCSRVNAIRTTGPQMVPDRATILATQIRAPELALSYSATRPNGDNGVKLLNSCGVDWDSATHQRNRAEITSQAEFEEDLATLIVELVDSFKGTYDDGRYYTKFGTSIYITYSGDMFYASSFGIVEE